MTGEQAALIRKDLEEFFHEFLADPPPVIIARNRIDAAQAGLIIMIGSDIQLYECVELTPDDRPDYRRWIVCQDQLHAEHVELEHAMRSAVRLHAATVFDQWMKDHHA